MLPEPRRVQKQEEEVNAEINGGQRSLERENKDVLEREEHNEIECF